MALVVLIAPIILEIEHIHQIADCRAVLRNVGIGLIRNGIGEVVAAACRQGVQIPILFDEFENRHVIRIDVIDVAAFGEWGDDDERNARTIAEEVESKRNPG